MDTIYISGASNTLVSLGTKPVPDHSSSGHRMFCLYRDKTPGTAPASPTRFSLRPAIHPAGETPEILVGTVEASALPDGWNHAYFYFCGLYDPGDSRLLGADCRRLRKFRDAGPGRKKRAYLRHQSRTTQRPVVFLCMVIAIDAAAGVQTSALRRAGRDSAKPTPPTPSSCWH